MKGICNLCREEKDLIKKSHIIPDFFYVESGLFSKTHWLKKIKSDEFHQPKKHSSLPTGEYEGGILCKSCDNEIIGSYEDYIRKVLYGGLSKRNSVYFSQVKGAIKIEELNYDKFTLFFLSILWRAAISSREMFSEIRIDDVNLEKLRVMILEGKAKRKRTYPVNIWTYWHDKTIPKDFIPQPYKIENGKTIMYSFLIGGLLINYYLKSSCFNRVIKNSISKKGVIIFRFMPGGKEGLEFLKRYGKIRVANNVQK